ncbi:MAG TPA: type III pantothenate kinase [Rubrobacteraceae bacterium]|nr:type III pantothenate kinase [Rubrobacteraceae bacterium]
MLLAVDIGNTQTVLGLFEGEELRGHWRLATESHRTADELAVVFAGLLDLNGQGMRDVSAMIVSSVVPALSRSYSDLADDVFGVPFYRVTMDMKTGLDNRYDDPSAVGADRIVNAVAAGHYYGFPAIIVDIGTATTVEAVDGDGCYLGGAIMTGLDVALEALVSRTAKLPSVDLEGDPPNAIATNTPDSIRSGFIYGYAGAIDALIRRSREELGAENVRTIVTGGPAGAIARHCQEIQEYDPDLTLKGLRVLYEMNVS